jgi:hypothetical protein
MTLYGQILQALLSSHSQLGAVNEDRISNDKRVKRIWSIYSSGFPLQGFHGLDCDPELKAIATVSKRPLLLYLDSHIIPVISLHLYKLVPY